MNDLKAVYKEITNEAVKIGFQLEEIYKCLPVPIVALTKIADKNPATSIFISGGIHGDEPAGVLAIKELFTEGYFTDGINWYIFPILNPTGLEKGTRENADGVDLNRDYLERKSKEVQHHINWFRGQKNLHIDLAITLHEDWESKGFYLYALENESIQSFVPLILKTASKTIPIDTSEIIDEKPAKDGLICINKQDLKKELKDMMDWPEAFYLMHEYDPVCKYTFETPSEFPLKDRVKTHVETIKATVEAFLERQQKDPSFAQQKQ